MTAKGPLPKVAIGLAGSVFIPGNKAFALATLRHEIEHAAHDQMAVDWMQTLARGRRQGRLPRLARHPGRSPRPTGC